MDDQGTQGEVKADLGRLREQLHELYQQTKPATDQNNECNEPGPQASMVIRGR